MSIVRSVTMSSASTAACATIVPGAKRTFVILVICVRIVRSFAPVVTIVKTVLWFAKDAESIATNVTKKYVKAAVCAWSAQGASRIFVSNVFCVRTVLSFVFADIVKTAPNCVLIAENIVPSVTIPSAWSAADATTAPVAKKIFVLTVTYAAVAPKSVSVAGIVQVAPNYVPVAENIVPSVTIIFVPTAVCATSARAVKKTFVILVICVRIAR